MPLRMEAIGETLDMGIRRWDSKDALLYALGIGAGARDPLDELEYTTENSDGHPQQVYPSFVSVLSVNPRKSLISRLGEVDLRTLVHAEQGFTLHRPLPVSGAVAISGRINGIYDKRSGALVVGSIDGVDVADGKPLFTTRVGYFIRGETGSGTQPEAGHWETPGRAPDHEVSQPTRPDQTLLYRLSGDRNPLHSDPAFAVAAGFPRPILHGLATYGFAFRALGQGPAGGDAQRVGAMSARFTRPVFPGATLVTHAWVDRDHVLFQTSDDEGNVVLDRGSATLSGAAGD